MDFTASNQSCLEWQGDCLIVGLLEESLPLTGILSDLNHQVKGLLQTIIDEESFDAKAGTMAMTRLGPNSPIKKIGVVGLGSSAAMDLESLRRGAAIAAKLAQKAKCASLGLSFPVWNNSQTLTAQAITEGIVLALTQDNRFKSEPDKSKTELTQIHLLSFAGKDAAIEKAQQSPMGVMVQDKINEAQTQANEKIADLKSKLPF